MLVAEVVIGPENLTLSSGFQTITPWIEGSINLNGWFNPSFPERLTVPNGYQFIEFNMGYNRNPLGATTDDGQIYLIKNSNGVEENIIIAIHLNNNEHIGNTICSGPLQVSPGDYFYVRSSNNVTYTLNGDSTFGPVCFWQVKDLRSS